MSKFWAKRRGAILLVLLLVVTLPLTVGLVQKAVQLLTGASFRPAAIVVDASQLNGPFPMVWAGLSQGHEKKDLRLDTVTQQVKNVGVKYVRIDHVLDGFGVVERTDGRLVYDYTRLDLLVSDILAMGATPYFAISYMPSAISRGDVVDLPNDWGEWGQVTANLVGHYSRVFRGGITNIIYEVWNEPDLFGGWKMYGEKSYTQLYSVASRAAQGVSGAKPFKIGGPATTGFYPAWVDGFYSKLDSQVRIDFFSWHRYSARVDDFVDDAQKAASMIAPQITRAQDLYISEWGVNPERGSQYDGRWAAAHYLAVVRALSDTAVDLALAFEIQDGDQADEQFHGGWGMLTNSKYGPIAKKPRFRAMELVSRLKGERVSLAGEGDFVTAFGAVDDRGVLRVLAVNYDERGKHSEVFPLTISGLNDATYEVTEEYLSGRVVRNTITGSGGILRRDIAVGASEAVLLTVSAK